jgi:uncharacterized protein DUF6178
MGRPVRRSARPVRRGAPDGRALIDRLLAVPQPARAIRQLQRVLDLDLLQPAPWRDETLDSGRFVAWLDALLEAGPALAAQMLMRMDDDLVIAALADHVHVFDRAAVRSLEARSFPHFRINRRGPAVTG